MIKEDELFDYMVQYQTLSADISNSLCPLCSAQDMMLAWSNDRTYQVFSLCGHQSPPFKSLTQISHYWEMLKNGVIQ